MRKYLVLIAVCIYSFVSNAQNVGIGVPDPQNKLHVGGGFRLDTLTGVGGAGLVWHNPGGVVYSIKLTGNTNEVLRGDGTFGAFDINGSIGWLLNGNSGTNPATHYLGTTDDQPLLFRVNNIRHGYLNGDNIFFGRNAGLLTTTGKRNIAIGSGALGKNVIMENSIAIGDSALHNITGRVFPLFLDLNNVAIGYKSLYANVDGSSNIAIGSFALQNNTNSGNIGIGNSALFKNTSGFSNTALGNNALGNNTTGANNLAIGVLSMQLNSVGSENIAVGNLAMTSNTTGTKNVAVGVNALSSNRIGSENTAIGSYALFRNIGRFPVPGEIFGGNWNTAVGSHALYENTQGSLNTATGYQALQLNQTGNLNSAFGFWALYGNSSGYENTAIGHSSLTNNNSYFNTGVGGKSLNQNSSGHDNTALGYSAMFSNTTASFNTSVGAFSLYNNTGDGNTAVGYKALEQNESGFDNTAIGFGALQGNKSFLNTAIGNSALRSNTSGIGNTAVGTFALRTIETGGFNTAIGFASGWGYNPNTPNLPDGLAPNVSNVTCIGFDAGFRTTGSNQVNIGNFSVGWIGGNVGWGTYSDKRMKQDIKENVPGLDFIIRLKPVTYHINLKKEKEIAKANLSDEYNWDGKYDIEKRKMTGFLAQDVEMAAAEINYNFSGVHKPKNGDGLYSLEYSAFVVPLVKAVQEQQAIINKQQKQIDELIKRLEALEKK